MENEKRLISADVAKEMIVNHANEFSDVLNRREKALLIGGGTSCIDKCPTVDAVPVVHGEWMEDYETFVDDSGKESYPIQTGYVCSECGKDGYPNWHYCPNCGAKMDLKGE